MKAKETLRLTLRRNDPEAYLTRIVLPKSQQQDFTTIKCFNHEIASVKDSVRGNSTLGRLRLEWWRDALDKAYSVPNISKIASSIDVDANPVLSEISGLSKRVHKAHFDALVDARFTDLASTSHDQPFAFETLEDVESYAMQTVAPQLFAFMETLRSDVEESDVLGEAQIKTVEAASKCLGLANVLRGCGYFLSHGEVRLPRNLLEITSTSNPLVHTTQTILTQADLVLLLKSHDVSMALDENEVKLLRPKLRSVSEMVAKRAMEHLADARETSATISSSKKTAFLPLVCADEYLQRLAKKEFDVFDPSVNDINASRLRVQLRLLYKSIIRRF